jgi:hypothetical protein
MKGSTVGGVKNVSAGVQITTVEICWPKDSLPEDPLNDDENPSDLMFTSRTSSRAGRLRLSIDARIPNDQSIGKVGGGLGRTLRHKYGYLHGIEVLQSKIDQQSLIAINGVTIHRSKGTLGHLFRRPKSYLTSGGKGAHVKKKCSKSMVDRPPPVGGTVTWAP